MRSRVLHVKAISTVILKIKHVYYAINFVQLDVQLLQMDMFFVKKLKLSLNVMLVVENLQTLLKNVIQLVVLLLIVIYNFHRTTRKLV